jgi:hypothetical protein
MTQKGEQAKQAPPRPVPINEEALKGVWIDGVGIHIGKDYAILEGVIGNPRTEKPLIVSRVMFPTRLLEQMAKMIDDALEKMKRTSAEGKL